MAEAKNTRSNPKDTRTQPAEDGSKLLHRLKVSYYATWSVVGLIIILAALIAVISGGPATEDLNLTGSQAATNPPAAAQQQSQPTEQQLSCVREALGQERFQKLQQDPNQNPTAEETEQIRQCLQGSGN